MRILVVGGNGFIGSHFVETAASAGHELIVCGYRPTPVYAHGQRFTFIPGGIQTLADNPSLLRRVDVVCHFASSAFPASSNADPLGDIKDNLASSVRLFEAMRAADVARVVYLSSGGAVYGRPTFVPITEEHPTDPISSYGVVKLAVEKYLHLYAHQHGFRPLIVRPANPYGPGQGKVGQLGAATTFLRLALTGQTAVVWGDGSVIRDFVYVSDLCELLLEGIQRGAIGIFNCGSGIGTSLSELIAIVEQTVGRKLAREHRAARPFDPPSTVLSIDKSRRELGWEPKVALIDGLRETLSSMEGASWSTGVRA